MEVCLFLNYINWGNKQLELKRPDKNDKNQRAKGNDALLKTLSSPNSLKWNLLQRHGIKRVCQKCGETVNVEKARKHSEPLQPSPCCLLGPSLPDSVCQPWSAPAVRWPAATSPAASSPGKQGLKPGNTRAWWRRHRRRPDLVSQPLVLEWPGAASHSLSTCHSGGPASCRHFSPGDEFKIP